MQTLWNYYLNFSIKTRLTTLCVCYSICIVAAALTAQSASPLIKFGAPALFIVAGGIFGWINIWSINRPIQRAIGYLETMAGGDLSETVTVLRKNEFSKMFTAMRHLQESMRGIIAGIQQTAGELAGASDQLRATSAQIVEGTEHASEQSDSITTAVDEMASVSIAISHNCQQMAAKAASTDDATRSGETTIFSMTAMMEAIERMVIDTTEAVKALGVNSERIG